MFTSMTTATDKCTYRLERALALWLAAAMLAVGLSTSAAMAEEATKEAASKATAVPADASVMCNGIRFGDEIDLVNTRSICGTGDADFMRRNLKFETYAVCDETGNRRWQSSDIDAFLSFDPAVQTIFFVHGNQIMPGEAKSEGLAVYRKMILQNPDAERVRYVILSWPASKVGGLLRDAREKAARTEPAGYHLAWLLDQMPADTQISLIGFSFGARIITGGLHIVAGGSLGGSLKLNEPAHPHRAPVNVVLIAAASHSYWLGEGSHHGKAMTQINRALFINNCQDRAMVYYDLLVPGRGGPQAMGLCGPTGVKREYSEKIFNRDVSRYVGSSHDLMQYLCAPGDAGLMWDYAGPSVVSDTKIGG